MSPFDDTEAVPPPQMQAPSRQQRETEGLILDEDGEVAAVGTEPLDIAPPVGSRLAESGAIRDPRPVDLNPKACKAEDRPRQTRSDGKADQRMPLHRESEGRKGSGHVEEPPRWATVRPHHQLFSHRNPSDCVLEHLPALRPDVYLP